MENSNDDLTRRCPRLGGEVAFKYCRFADEDRQPCWKMADCWWERFDVMAYLREVFSEEELQVFLEVRPKPKLTSIVELIEQARQRTGGKE